MLVAIASLGLACNDVVSASAATIKQLSAAGLIDPEPAAVAYAKSNGAKVVELDPESPVAEVVDAATGASGAADAAAPAAAAASAEGQLPLDQAAGPEA